MAAGLSGEPVISVKVEASVGSLMVPTLKVLEVLYPLACRVICLPARSVISGRIAYCGCGS